MKDYYHILGISPGAGRDEIKRAYHALAKRFHPDRNPGNLAIEERFKEISEAYNVLSDDESRRKYDLKRAYRNSGQRTHATDGSSRFRKQRNPDFQFRQKKKSRQETRSERMTSYMFGGILVFFAALMITMLIVGPWNDDDDEQLKALLTRNLKAPDFTGGPTIYSADSPYDSVFGGSWILEDNHNSVIVVNTKDAETVVCLQEAKPPFRTIRNEYLDAGEVYRLNAIPQGTYFLKAYFGRDWDPQARLLGGKVRGGFKHHFGFFISDESSNLIHISHKNAGEHIQFTTYQVYLSALFKQPGREISEQIFFK